MEQKEITLEKGVLNEAQKDAIVQYHLSGGKFVTQTWIANHFSVSRKTVYNVLKERGALLDKQEVTKLLGVAQVMKELNLTPDKIRKLANVPALTPHNIISQLAGLEEQELKDIVYQLIGLRYMTDCMYQEATRDAD